MQLPWELEEKILSLIPIKSFGRLRSVCKRWNTLNDDVSFVKQHLAHARPQFILLTKNKICSVEVSLDDGPSIKVHDLPSDIPGRNQHMHETIEYCDGLLVYVTPCGTGICNPWLKQMKWMNPLKDHRDYNGMGYDNSRPDNHYKIFMSNCSHNKKPLVLKAKITEFGSDEWKFLDFAYDEWFLANRFYSVSLNGTLYWPAVNDKPLKIFIQSFDFSTESFKPYCNLPHSKNMGSDDAKSLAVYRQDRFSFLEQNCETRNIKIWVTKEKIRNGDGEDVEWVKLMNVPVPQWSSLRVDNNYPPSYFIDEDKSLSLVLCCYNKESKSCIYISRGDKFHEFAITDLVDDFPTPHRTYFPSLVQVPKLTMSGNNKTRQVRSRFGLPNGVEANNGVGESEWDDGFFEAVKKISVGWNEFGVVFVKFDYCNGGAVVVGHVHGNVLGATGDDDDILIDDDDYIEAVEGTYNESHITCITFRMHQRDRKHLTFYGRFNGTPFALGKVGGSKIVGFYGRSSDVHLTALGVHLK